MAVVGAWLLFAVYPFYVSRLVLINKQIEAASAARKDKPWWKFW